MDLEIRRAPRIPSSLYKSITAISQDKYGTVVASLSNAGLPTGPGQQIWTRKSE
jgi:hypothetical protein